MGVSSAYGDEGHDYEPGHRCDVVYVLDRPWGSQVLVHDEGGRLFLAYGVRKELGPQLQPSKDDDVSARFRGKGCPGTHSSDENGVSFTLDPTDENRVLIEGRWRKVLAAVRTGLRVRKSMTAGPNARW